MIWVAHSASCGFTQRMKKARERGRHILGIVSQAMSPAFAGSNVANVYPQLALWATDIVAGFAG